MKETYPSHAKINLYLEITGKRADGYHELKTVMQEIKLHDELTIESAPSFELQTRGAKMPPVEDNLLSKAYHLMSEHFPGKIKPVKVFLQKNIPLGGGLGGGSSNAVLLLKILAEKYLGGQVDLNDLASRLGSDTNFFLSGKTALCEGRGEKVFALKHRKLFYNLIFPEFSCSTARVFSGFKKNSESGPQDWIKIWQEERCLPALRNDLKEACVSVYPEINRILGESVHSIHLSGSGSTCFTCHENESDRDQIFDALQSIENVKLIQTESVD